MKIRTGYVSNSSSSSFCIMGVCLEKDEVQEAIAKRMEESDEYDEYKAEKEIFGLFGTHGIYEYGESVIYGLSVEEMKEHETLLEFKKRVFQTIKYPGIKFEDVKWRIDGGPDN